MQDRVIYIGDSRDKTTQLFENEISNNTIQSLVLDQSKSMRAERYTQVVPLPT